MPTSYTFGSSVGTTGRAGFYDGTDGTVTAVVDDGSIQAGDAVTLSGFDVNTRSLSGLSDGNAYYLGTSTFNGHTGYVFGLSDTVDDNEAFFVVFTGEEGNSMGVAMSAMRFASDPGAEPLGSEPACFATGTRIAVPGGERPVEDLRPGDLVTISDGRAVPVRWIGRQTVHKAFCSQRTQPVRVGAEALGPGQPHADLVLTSDHALVIDGFAITAGALANGTTIAAVPLEAQPDQMTFHHVETEAHEVLLANGAPAETFGGGATRRLFDNYRDYVDRYGAERDIPEMPLPRILSARLVPAAIAARLARRADRLLPEPA